MATFSIVPLNTPYMLLRALSYNYNVSRGRNEECECSRHYDLFQNDERLAFIGFSTLALVLLLLCALLSGLTLAICSLDIIWLQVLSMTGNDRQRLVLLNTLTKSN
jgi:hypothetical protein